MKALNGDNKFKEQGIGICRDMNENFPLLTIEQLFNIRKAYKADYYLTWKERADLKAHLVYRNRVYYVYDIKHVFVEL
ncbi:MAG: hypothetical protein GY931_19770 [Maribacter sp.]|nr:hypothetical protein [Maribacter sp.]